MTYSKTPFENLCKHGFWFLELEALMRAVGSDSAAYLTKHELFTSLIPSFPFCFGWTEGFHLM